MRKKRLHVFTIILGSILAFAISFSQFFSPVCDGESSKIKTEQAGNTGGDETESYISLPTFSLPVPVHVQASLDAYCLFEIFFEKDTDVDHVEENMFYTDRFFETMFRVIISPNAP
jgi:hypothetical protein